LHYIEAPCINGDEDGIRSVNNESRIFFLFGPRLLSRSKHSVQNAYISSEKKINILMANDMYKMKITLHRHGPRLMPNSCNILILDPPNFSLPITFKLLMLHITCCFLPVLPSKSNAREDVLSLYMLLHGDVLLQM
jgi:hypothetical protein